MLVILLGSGNGLKNGTLSNFGSMAVNSVIINGGMYAATFPCKNPCHPLEHQSFSRCRNRHLASFGNEDEMV